MDAKQMHDAYFDNVDKVREITDEAAQKIADIFLPYCETETDIRVFMNYVETLVMSSLGVGMSYLEIQKTIEFRKAAQQENLDK